jgi:hypothetical protein
MLVWKNEITTALLLFLLATLRWVASDSSGDPAPDTCNPSERNGHNPDASSSSLAGAAATASPSKSSKECLVVTEHEPGVVTTSETDQIVAPSLGRVDESTTPAVSTARLLELAYAQIVWLEQEHKGMFAKNMIQIKPVDHDDQDQLQTDILLGLFASQNITKGTVVMKIPRSVLLTAGKV